MLFWSYNLHKIKGAFPMPDSSYFLFVVAIAYVFAMFVGYMKLKVDHRLKVIEEQCNLQIKELQRQIDKLRKTS